MDGPSEGRALDAREAAGHPCVVMRRILLACLCAAGLAHAQVVAPAEVTSSAVAAVEDLGKQLILGRHKVAIDRMYPTWKERSAKQAGGEAALEAQLARVAQIMAAENVSLISFKTRGVPTAYEVWPGKKTEMIDGKPVETMVFEKWLMLIPTEAVFRRKIPNQEPPQWVNYTTYGFQVAISDKGKNTWTFIDGSSVTVSELRSLFLTLPENMELPKIERKSSPASK